MLTFKRSYGYTLRGGMIIKIAGIALLAIMMGTAFAQDDTETKKKRLGEILKQVSQLQGEAEKILAELTRGDKSKYDALLREVAEKYAPEFGAEMARGQTASNERNASASLKSLATAQADFRANDRDENHVNDFWVADVSGLYRISVGGAIKLIEESIARADARPCVPLETAGVLPGAAKEHASKLIALGKSTPKAGYWFVTIDKYQDERGKEAKYNDGNGRNTSMFGMCSYPSEYGKTGKITFILNEENVMWKKDTGGKPPDVFPSDPEKAGWTKLF